ncbi:hypothetical protein [Streptococcus suis]|uniref:hypothetical protein n=1 Tax=Streptococcus suis TaxID=1307 RepID=UPI003B9EB18B
MVIYQTVCPLCFQTVALVGRIIRGLHNFKAISSSERAFYLRLHALQVAVSSYARVLSYSHKPTFGLVTMV